MDEREIAKKNIAEARKRLPEDTRAAIDSVDWRTVVLSMRESERFTFTQLEDLELETEMLLTGLVSPQEYPRNLERKMGISKSKSLDLLDTLNSQVFKKIRENLEGKLESKKKVSSTYSLEPETPAPSITAEEESVLASAGVEIKGDSEIKKEDNKPKEVVATVVQAPEITPVREIPKKIPTIQQAPVQPVQTAPVQPKIPDFSSQKLSGAYQMKSTVSDHSPTTPKKNIELAAKPTIPSVDPYREMPE